jgi:hypothetical protein
MHAFVAPDACVSLRVHMCVSLLMHASLWVHACVAADARVGGSEEQGNEELIRQLLMFQNIFAAGGGPWQTFPFVGEPSVRCIFGSLPR